VRRVGYYFCEHCFETKLFVLWEPPWDDYAAVCVECHRHHGGCEDGEGWAEGGYTIRHVVVDLGVEEIGEANGQVEERAEVQPVITREQLLAGKAALQAEVAEQMRQTYGVASEFTKAYERLRQGLSSDDPAIRASLLNRPDPMRRGRKA